MMAEIDQLDGAIMIIRFLSAHPRWVVVTTLAATCAVACSDPGSGDAGSSAGDGGSNATSSGTPATTGPGSTTQSSTTGPTTSSTTTGGEGGGVGGTSAGGGGGGGTARVCGDGVIDPDEVCDGSNLGPATCVREGFSAGGTLECGPTCDAFVTTACGKCDDQTKNGTETDVDCGGLCPKCDVGATCSGAADCASARCCSGTCQAAWLSGWSFRTPITVTTDAQLPSLVDYQVQVMVDASALVAAGKLDASGKDVRVTLADGTTQLPHWLSQIDTTTSNLWVKVPSLSPGTTTTLFLYYGNAAATNTASLASTFEQVLTNGDFEVAGAWSVDASHVNGASGSASWPDGGFHSNGSNGLHLTISKNVSNGNGSYYAVTQQLVLPPGPTSYEIIHDWSLVNFTSPPNGNCGGYAIFLDWTTEIAALNCISNPTSGPRYDVVDSAIAAGTYALELVAFADASTSASDVYFDNVRVKKTVNPEPAAVLGTETTLACQ
jgi:hypothetical protein